MPANPTASNCLALPCVYKGECRGASGECGDTNEFCNDDSIWIPACGGGADLNKEPEFENNDKPVPTTSPQLKPQPMSPPPTNEPVMIPTSLQNMMNNPTTKAPQSTIQIIESPSDEQQDVTAAAVMTSSPTTAWQAWIGQQTKDDEQSGTNNQGSNETNNNQPDWFTDVADNWDERYNNTEQSDDNGDGGFFDSIGNWFDGNSATTTCLLGNEMMVLIATVIMVWVVI